jgi:hypothetical protein
MIKIQSWKWCEKCWVLQHWLNLRAKCMSRVVLFCSQTLLVIVAIASVVVAQPPWRPHHPHHWGGYPGPGRFGYPGPGRYGYPGVPKVIVIVKEKTTPTATTTPTAAPTAPITAAPTTTPSTAAPTTTPTTAAPTTAAPTTPVTPVTP